MTIKAKSNLKWIPSLVVTLFMTTGAVMKFVNAPGMLALYTGIGLQDRMTILGITEILFISLFLWPRTMKIGFFLLTGYYGGAMAIELSLGMMPLVPSLILTIIWIAAFLREASLFRPATRQQRSMASL